MHAMFISRSIRAALLVAAAAAAGCTTQDTEPPALSGPSEFGQSISVTATPDRISQDGVSQVRAEATIRGPQGQPSQGVAVQWTVDASTGVLVEPSLQQSVTDAQGRTAIAVTAPPPPVFVPATPARLTITAKVVGTDEASTMNTKSVVVQLVPPPGTLLPNRLPEPSFSISPAIGNIMQDITFDASQTKDEGEPCNASCTYQWHFGDLEVAAGQIVTHAYQSPSHPPPFPPGASGPYTVTLTVTDSRGGVASTTRSLTINGPALPTVVLTPSPSTVSLAVSGRVAFRAAASIGLGGNIEQYEWYFGDGNSQTTTEDSVIHTYTTTGPMPVRVTITDNFGRKVTATNLVTVSP